jgi:hypothetical protein
MTNASVTAALFVIVRGGGAQDRRDVCGERRVEGLRRDPAGPGGA